MPNRGPFPSKDSDLNTYFIAVVAYIILNATRLRIDHGQQDTLQQLMDIWMDIYPKSQDEGTRTKSVIEDKDVAKVNMIQHLRIIYGDIPQSVLTSLDRNTLHIDIKNSARTPVAPPSTRPVGQVNTSNRLEHTIIFTDEDGSHARPKGARGCQIWYKEGEPITNYDELSFMATDTKSPYIHRFPVDKAGKTVHYWLRWENTRGEVGPWSTVVTATVTG